MTDVRIASTGDGLVEAVTLDLLLTPLGDLDARNDLATAMTVALCTDARAEPDDVLPTPGDDDRRGWWADLDAAAIWDGWPIGSRLWLLSRTAIAGPGAQRGATTVQIEDYIREALQPFLDRQIATGLDVAVARVGLDRIEAAVTLIRGPGDAIELRFADLWRGIATSAPTA